MTTQFSNRNESAKIKGEFYVTYAASRLGKKYTATHINPCGSSKTNISADELNDIWQKSHKGICPFNGDSDFEVLKIQQRFNA